MTPISVILKKAKSDTSIPKKVIHDAIWDGHLSCRLESTIDTILNAVMIATPNKRARVAYTIFEYCIDVNLNLDDEYNIKLIDNFVNSNLYMKCMFTHDPEFKVYNRVYPTDKKLKALRTTLKTLKSESLASAISSEAKAWTLVGSMLSLQTHNNYKSVIDEIMKQKSLRFAIQLLDEIHEAIDNNTNLTLGSSQRYAGYWSVHYGNSLPITFISGMKIDKMVEHFIINTLPQLCQSELKEHFNSIAELTNATPYTIKIQLLDENGNVVQ